MSSSEAQKYVYNMRSKAGGNSLLGFSSLEQVRSRADQELEACAKDEKRTREYLHRAKVACSLVLQRRQEKEKLLLGLGDKTASRSQSGDLKRWANT